jgi:hypothetical protein
MDLSLQHRLALTTQTPSVGIIRAEWSEQQEDPNIEKLWEEDWDDDQVTLQCSADIYVTEVEPGLPMVRQL